MRGPHHFGNATVYVPEDNDPNHGGGPIRRSVGITMPSGDGMPPNGWPQMVLRTPHAVVQDAESGGARWPGLQYQKFLPDGRLVPANALGGAMFGSPGFLAFGADPAAAASAAANAAADAAQATAAAAERAAHYSQSLSDWIARWGVITLGAFVVGAAGAVLAPSGYRARTGTVVALSFAGGAIFARYVQEHPVVAVR